MMRYLAVERVPPLGAYDGQYAVERIDPDGERTTVVVFDPNGARSPRLAAEDYAAWSNRQSALNQHLNV